MISNRNNTSFVQNIDWGTTALGGTLLSATQLAIHLKMRKGFGVYIPPHRRREQNEETPKPPRALTDLAGESIEVRNYHNTSTSVSQDYCSILF